MLRTAALLSLTFCGTFAFAQLTSLPKKIPGVVDMQQLGERPESTVKPQYPDSVRQRWVQGTISLDAVIGTNGKVEELGCDDYCHQFPPELVQAAADAVKQWQWRPVTVKGKPVRVRTRIPITFTLDDSTPPISVCNILKDPKWFIGRNLNVFGTVKQDRDIKVLTSANCEGEIELEDDSALTPPVKDAKYAAMQQSLSIGPTTISVRGLVRDENRPGALPGQRVILERVLKVYPAGQEPKH